MAYYLVQGTYAPETWAGLVKSPQDRTGAWNTVMERLGGSVVGFWLTVGEADLVSVVNLPDNVSAVSASLAANAGGAIQSIKTTPLLSWEGGVAAMKRANDAGYRPPS